MHMWVIYGGRLRSKVEHSTTSLYKPACTARQYRFGRTHGAPYRGYGYVPLRFGGNVVRRMGTQQQQ